MDGARSSVAAHWVPDRFAGKAMAGACAPDASGWHGSPGLGLLKLAGLVICVVSKVINVSLSKSPFHPLPGWASRAGATSMGPLVRLPPKACTSPAPPCSNSS